jgi:hypothetical protein
VGLELSMTEKSAGDRDSCWRLRIERMVHYECGNETIIFFSSDDLCKIVQRKKKKRKDGKRILAKRRCRFC